MNITVLYSLNKDWRIKKENICRLAESLHGHDLGIGVHYGTCDLTFDFAQQDDASNFVRAIRERFPDAGTVNQADLLQAAKN
jgi:hypothetical protein